MSKMYTFKKICQQGHILKCELFQRKLKCTLGNSKLRALAVIAKRLYWDSIMHANSTESSGFHVPVNLFSQG